ncbi:hypothetical protein BKA62DRAFT_676426 [Auriculariales sp. MPI-PUGE-AT-0066]|nr:hypothetical protein BKA62DRAFT_676426 [Auriculariales sp. MPI-PUGE-AT-0066]
MAPVVTVPPENPVRSIRVQSATHSAKRGHFQFWLVTGWWHRALHLCAGHCELAHVIRRALAAVSFATAMRIKQVLPLRQFNLAIIVAIAFAAATVASPVPEAAAQECKKRCCQC